MKKFSKVMAVILAGGILLSATFASAENSAGDSLTLNTIDHSINIVVDTAGKIFTNVGKIWLPENAERINVTIPDYKNGAKAQKLKEFAISNDEALYLCFDMIDGGTGEETCDITLMEAVSDSGKKIETTVATIENLKLKSVARITGFMADKSYSLTVQSKTKSGNASFLFWMQKDLNVDFVLDNNVNESGNDIKVIEFEPQQWNKDLTALSEYGIFSGDPDGDFRPYSNITRAEIAKAICTALRLTPDIDGKQSFSDVDSSHWAYGYINALAASKIVAGGDNGCFEPDREATYSEAVKMLVCALGYAPIAEQKGGYPYGYIEIAEEIGLTKDLICTLDGLCQRNTAFTLFNNALDIPLLIGQTGFGDAAEYYVADGENGGDYKTFRYIITGKKN